MTKACWQVTASGRTFAMVGSPCTYDEALEFARGDLAVCRGNVKIFRFAGVRNLVLFAGG